MKKITLLSLVLFAVCAVLFIAAETEINGKNDKFRKSIAAIPNRYIVVLEDEKKASFEAELNRRFDATIEREFHHVNGYSVEMSEDAAVLLSQDERVKYVEEDARIFAAEIQTDAAWGLDRIDQRAMPLDGYYNFARTGRGVNAYIIDSGIRITHSDFAGRANPGFDAFDDGQNSIDCNGHGTHVAGTVGGGVFGVAKEATLHSVRVLDCRASGTTSTLIAGIDWVTNNHQKPAVANISIISGASAALDAAIVSSISSGVTYVVSAGNNGVDACTFSPAHVSSAITVGASDALDNKPAWSNFGFCVDIFAPGVFIESTSFASDSATAYMSGTSMAAPHVTGAAALYLEENPSASPAVVAAVILSSATQEKLLNAGSGSPDRLLFASPPPPTAATVCLSGQVTTNYKFFRRRRRFSVTITNSGTSRTQTTFTDKRGFYEFCDLTAGETYIIDVRGKGYEFAAQVLTLTEDGNLNFYAAGKK